MPPDAIPAILTGSAPATPPNNSPFHQATAPQPAPHVQPPAARQAELSPNERARQSQAEGDAATKRYDPEKVIQTRDDRGNLVLKDRLTGAVLDDGGNIDPNAPPPVDPAAERVKIGDVELTPAEWAAAAAHKAEADLRAAQVPATAADYKIELPPDLVLPENTMVSLDPNDPIKGSALVAAQNWAAANKLSQEQFSQMLGLYAASSVNEAIDFNNRQRAEVAALGTAAPVRIDAITKWLSANFGDTAARPIISTLATRHHVEVFEKIISKLTNQGAGSFSQRGREVDTGKVDDAAWDRMSYSEKKDYSARMSQQAGPGGRR